MKSTYNEIEIEKEYIKAMKIMNNKPVSNTSDEWNEELDRLFWFLYNGAIGILPPIDESYKGVYIRYNDHFLWLFENLIVDVDCLRIIEPTSFKPISYVRYEDVVRFHTTGKKPIISSIMDVVIRGLETLETALGTESIELVDETLYFKDIKQYLDDNLMYFTKQIP